LKHLRSTSKYRKTTEKYGFDFLNTKVRTSVFQLSIWAMPDQWRREQYKVAREEKGRIFLKLEAGRKLLLCATHSLRLVYVLAITTNLLVLSTGMSN
jgi:hypothetical protein